MKIIHVDYHVRFAIKVSYIDNPRVIATDKANALAAMVAGFFEDNKLEADAEGINYHISDDENDQSH